MASPVEDLQRAGFSEDEIAAWATERRGELTTAGFKPNEIDAYFTGGVTAPEKPPMAFVERVDTATAVFAKMHPILAKAGAGLVEGYGDPTPTGMSDQMFNDFIKLGIFHDPLKGKPNPIQFWNAAIAIPTAKTIDMLLRSVSAGVHGAGALVGGAIEEITGSETEGKQAKRETINFANWAMIELGMGSFARTRVTPQGVIEEQVGGLAKSEDFVNAAKVLTEGEAPSLVVARQMPDGTVKYGRPGEVHSDLMTKPELDATGPTPPAIESAMGFAVPGGRFMTRTEALDYAARSEPARAAYSMEKPEFGLEASTYFEPRAEAPLYVQQKLLRTYEERGVHPAEMAADAAADPVLKQKLLSKDPADMPYGLDAQGPETIRLYRGERDWGPYPNERYKPRAQFWTDDLERAKDYGEVRYIDIPREELARNFSKDAKGDYQTGDLEFKYHGMARPVEGAPPPRKPPGEPPPSAPPPYSDAQKAILDKISIGERDAKRPLSWDRLYTEIVDDLHPIAKLDKDAYQAARLTRGQFGKAEYMLEQGTFDFTTLKDTGRPLKAILEPVRDDLNGLRAYLASRRTVELEAQGRKSGFPLEEAKVVVAEGGARYAKIADELVEYQNRVLAYLKDSGVLSEESYAAMLEANRHYVPFYRLVDDTAGGPKAGSSLSTADPVKRLKGSERQTVDPIESIIKNTYAYVSVAERNHAGLAVIDALKSQGVKVTEAKRPTRVSDPELVQYLAERGITDEASQTIARVAHDIMEGKPQDGSVLRAYREGRAVEAVVDDLDLVNAFRALDREAAGMLVKVLAVPARTMRAGAVLTPDFIVRNTMRDLLTAFINSKGFFTPVDTLKGLYSVLRKDEHWGNWVKGGGANSAMVALDRAYLQESLTKLAGETGLMERSWNVIKHPGEILRPLRFLSETMENATRVGEFRKAVKGESRAAIEKGSFAGREVTLDFARMGAKMRSLNMISAFANAQIQGVDRIVRGFIDRPVNTSLKVAGGITLPSILLWWANHDDERYKQLPHWQKDLFWIIPTDKWEPISPGDAARKPPWLLRNNDTEFNNGSIYRIPKPFELGVIFGSGVERMLDLMIGNDKHAFDGFTKSAIEALTPNIIPTAAQPVVEQFANRSTFIDRTLIPADMEKHLPEYQYTPYTTQLSRKLGQVVAAFPGIRETSVDPGSPAGPFARAATSPILIENYVRAWTGGLGVYALQAADYGLRKQGILPDPITPAWTLADIPFVKAFIVRYPSAGMQPIQDFYDTHEKQKRFFDTYMARAKEGDIEAMQRIEAAGGESMFLKLDTIKETLSGHSKLIRDIYKNPELPAEQKRQLIDGLYYQMIQVGAEGRDMQRQVKATPAPAP